MRTSSPRAETKHRGVGAPGELDIVLVGPYPPPFGGVATHVVRTVEALQRVGLEVGVLNHFGSTEADVVIASLRRNPLRYFLQTRRLRARVLHYHHSRWSVLLAFALSQRRSPSNMLITIHGLEAARRLKLDVPLVGGVTRWAIARFEQVIVVNRELEAYLGKHVGSDRIRVLPAFVPASEAEEAAYEPDVEAFFSGGKVMLVSAYRVRPLAGGGDLYGLELAIDAFLALAPERRDLRLAVLIARRPNSRREQHYVRGLRQRVEHAGLAARSLWATERPLVPAFRHDVVLVRPTREDGDSVSVREALGAAVPVIASVVIRPAGVVTFANGSSVELRSAVELALDREPEQASPVDPADDSFGELLALYHGYLDRSPIAMEAART
jgi:glycosyltransferase involved in cell wall biosynthesis